MAVIVIHEQRWHTLELDEDTVVDAMARTGYLPFREPGEALPAYVQRVGMPSAALVALVRDHGEDVPREWPQQEGPGYEWDMTVDSVNGTEFP